MASKIQEKISANLSSVIENKFDELKAVIMKEIQDNIEKSIMVKTNDLVKECRSEMKDFDSRLNLLENKS